MHIKKKQFNFSKSGATILLAVNIFTVPNSVKCYTIKKYFLNSGINNIYGEATTFL